MTTKIQKKITGNKSIQSLLFVTFNWLCNKGVTKKSQKLKTLAYRVMMKPLRQFGVRLLRDFALSEFRKDFELWLTKSDSCKSKKRVSLRIDTTKTGKKYGKNIPELEWLYDYVNKCHINTHELFIVLVSIGKKNYIVDFVLMKKSERNGWKILTKKSIKRLLRNLFSLRKDFIEYARVSLDGGFGNGDIIKFLSQKGFRYVAVKSGGVDKVEYQEEELSLKGLENKLAQDRQFKDFNSKHRLKGEYCEVTVRLVKVDILVKIVLERFRKKKNQKYRYRMIISPNLNLNAYQIIQCYALRWGIEACIKECKDKVKVTDYSYHTKDTTENIETFIALRFIGYMIVNWYRAEHCKPSKTSFWLVAKRFEVELSKMNPKAFWNLFSP